ncbi:unnamed protein product [Chrysoparadoxa australica]
MLKAIVGRGPLQHGVLASKPTSSSFRSLQATASRWKVEGGPVATPSKPPSAPAPAAPAGGGGGGGGGLRLAAVLFVGTAGYTLMGEPENATVRKYQHKAWEASGKEEDIVALRKRLMKGTDTIKRLTGIGSKDPTPSKERQPSGIPVSRSTKEQAAPTPTPAPAPAIARVEEAVTPAVPAASVSDMQQEDSNSGSDGSRAPEAQEERRAPAVAADAGEHTPADVGEHTPASSAAVDVGSTLQAASDLDEAAQAVSAAAAAGAGAGRKSEVLPALSEEQLRARKLRLASIQAAADDCQATSAALRMELEATLLKDLEELDEKGLRYRIIQLAAEMQERTKWEALRLHEALKRTEEEASTRYLALMSEMTDKMQAQYSQLVLEAEQRVRSEVQGDFQKEFQRQLDQDRQRVQTVVEARLADEKHKLMEQVAEDSMRRQADLDVLAEKVRAVQAAWDGQQQADGMSQKIHKITAAALALAEAFSTSGPLGAELDALKVLSAGDELLGTALSSIPAPAAKSGIPTVEQLRVRFDTVHKECRKAVLVPHEAKGLSGQILGSVLAAVTVEPSQPMAGDNPEDVLTRAKQKLDLGNLGQAVEELEKLQGLAAYTVSDWVAEAKGRLSADQALNVIRMHTALLNKSLA